MRRSRTPRKTTCQTPSPWLIQTARSTAMARQVAFESGRTSDACEMLDDAPHLAFDAVAKVRRLSDGQGLLHQISSDGHHDQLATLLGSSARSSGTPTTPALTQTSRTRSTSRMHVAGPHYTALQRELNAATRGQCCAALYSSMPAQRRASPIWLASSPCTERVMQAIFPSSTSS